MSAHPLLSATGIAKKFGSFSALNGIDLKIRANTVHSVIGPNGAGKTTLFHVLSGTVAATSGRILFDGLDVTKEPDHCRVRRGLARSFQITSLFPSLTVRENLRLGAQGISKGKAFNCWHEPVGKRDSADIIDQVLEKVGISALANTTVGNLSHGQQRRLEVGMALAARPKLIFLDEPTSGMGIDDIEGMKKLIRSLRNDHTVVLIEHNMGIVMDISDMVTVMQEGRVLVEGVPATIRSNPRVRAAYLGNMITGGRQ